MELKQSSTLDLYLSKAHSYIQLLNIICNRKQSIPFKFSQNISHKNPAFHSFIDGVVVFKECEHVPTVLHRQTSD